MRNLLPWTCRHYHAGRGAHPVPVVVNRVTSRRAYVTSLVDGLARWVHLANLTPAPSVQRRFRGAYLEANRQSRVAEPAMAEVAGA